MFSILQQHCYTIYRCVYVCVDAPVHINIVDAPGAYYLNIHTRFFFFKKIIFFLFFFFREILKIPRDKQGENQDMSVGMSKKV
jgi:hypothetical protein